MPTTKLVIHGQVQGVGFRYWLRGKFMEMGIDGKAWNNDDGTVGVEFQRKMEGSEPSIKLIEALKQGPPLARVDKVTILKE